MVCFFQRKESDEERKVMERKSFYCLELSKIVKKRNDLYGAHIRNLSTTHGWNQEYKCFA